MHSHETVKTVSIPISLLSSSTLPIHKIHFLMCGLKKQTNTIYCFFSYLYQHLSLSTSKLGDQQHTVESQLSEFQLFGGQVAGHQILISSMRECKK